MNLRKQRRSGRARRDDWNDNVPFNEFGGTPFREAYTVKTPKRCKDRTSANCDFDGRCAYRNGVCNTVHCEDRQAEYQCVEEDGCGWVNRYGCGKREVNDDGTVDIFYSLPNFYDGNILSTGRR